MKRINDVKIGARLNIVFNLAFTVIIALLGIYTTLPHKENKLLKTQILACMSRFRTCQI